MFIILSVIISHDSLILHISNEVFSDDNRQADHSLINFNNITKI